MSAKGAGKTKKKKDLTIGEILDRKKPAVEVVKFLLDPEVRTVEREAFARVGNAELELRRAERKEAPVPVEVLDELAEAKKAHAKIVENEEHAVFRLIAIGSDELDKMMTKHRPTIAQLKEFQETLAQQSMSANEKLLYNPDTFPVALLSRCCESPAMTVEEATALWESDKFNRGELGKLFTTAWNVNQAVVI